MADFKEDLSPEPAPYHQGSAGGGEPAYKRAGMPREKLLGRYRARIDMSRKWREDEGYDKTWRRLNDLYRNKQFEDGLSDEDRIAVNISFSTINVIVPSVAVNYPQITVNPRTEIQAMQGEAAEAMLNYWWRHYDWRIDIKKIVKDSLVYGHGWAKIGWKYQSKQVDLTPDEIEGEFETQREEANQYAQAQPEMAAALPTDDDIRAGLPTTRTEAVKDCPYVERVSPYDMFIDPEATCEDDLKWIAQRIVLPLEDVQKDDRYIKAARNRLKPDASTNVRWRDENDRKKKYSDDVQRVTLYEFYDLRHNFYCVFAAEGEGFLLEPTDFPYPYGSPFKYLGNYDIPDYFYDAGDLEMIEPLQAELNAVRTDMRNHRKRWQRAYLALRDKFTPEAMDELVSDEDNRVVWIEGEENLEELLAPLPTTAPNPELYGYSDVITSDIEMITGVSDYQRGSMSETRRTATEASIIQDATNARAADKLAHIETFMRAIAERVLMLAQTFLTGEHMARITGPEGAAMWVPFSRDAIEGQFDFEVEAGSTQPKNEMFRRQQAMQMATALQPYVGVVVDPYAFVTHIMREGFGIKTPERFLLAPPVDPLTGMPMNPMDPMMQQPPPEEGSAPEGDGEGREQAASTGLTDGLTQPTDGPGAIPPEVLVQLQGQVGLDLPNMGGF